MGARAKGAQHSGRVTALRLLGTWNRISRGHVALATGCSCGVGSTDLRVQDFEEQILEFLQGRHRITAPTIADLLTGIAKAGGDEANPILADLERTLQSFEEQHSGR